MLLIMESKTKDIDKEVRLLRKYELAVREHHYPITLRN